MAKLVYEDIPDPLGSPWFGHTRSFSNTAKWPSTSNSVGQNGVQWFVSQWPYLVESGGYLIAELPGQGAYKFLDDGNGNYTVTPFQDDVTLTAQNLDGGQHADAGELVLTMGDEQVVFRDLAGTNGLSVYAGCLNAPRRAFKRYEAPSGMKVEVISYSPNGGRFLELQRILPSPDDDLIHSMVYTWVTATPPTETVFTDLQWLDSVELRESRNGQTGPWNSIRKSKYEYTTAAGNGDLHFVTLQKPDGVGGWENIGKHYYLYYLNDIQTGTGGEGAEIHAHRKIAMALSPEGYRRYMQDNNGDEPESFDGSMYFNEPLYLDALDDPSYIDFGNDMAKYFKYSEYYFDYYGGSFENSEFYGAVKLEIASASCTTCTTSGSVVGGDEFEYLLNSNYPSSPADVYNSWERRTIVTHADGSKECVFTNQFGDLILKVYEDSDASPVRRWAEYWRYDGDNRVILMGSPASLDLSSLPTDLSTWQPALDVVDDGGSNNLLRANAGKVEVTSYYTTTSATQSAAGGHKGAVKYSALKEGYSGTEIRINEYEYYSFSPSGSATVISPIAKTIQYPIAGDLSTKIETSYSYTYHTGSTAIATKTTTLPVISAAQNGSGVAATIDEVFDIYGQRTWVKDERGVITRYVYDNLIGSVVQMISDVDTAQTTDEPSGWATVSGQYFGNHLVADNSYDSLGRRTETLGPVHTADLNGVLSGGDTSVRRANWTVYVENGIDGLDEVRSAGGYATGSPGSYTYELVNPVSIRKSSKDGSSAGYESIQAKRASTSGKITDADTFNQSDYTAWSISKYNDSNQMTESRVYHTIPASGEGSVGANYYVTTYEYDVDNGDLIRTQSPDGTITRTVYDNWVGSRVGASIWVGTNDTDATPSDPSGGGASSNNMMKVSSNEYDASVAGGNGYLTKSTQHVNGVDTRETTYGYDWRNRQVSTDGEIDQYSVVVYDNLGRTTQTDTKNTNDTGHLASRSSTKYDDRGRVYETIIYEVDPTSGTVGDSLVSQTWYDAGGNVLKSQDPRGVFSKSVFDGLGRRILSYTSSDSSETDYADADDVVGDTVFAQAEAVYDDASNLLYTTGYERHHDEASATGDLTGSTARVTYNATWYDGSGRPSVSAAYGTNGGISFTRPDAAPVASNTTLVSLVGYDDAGRADTLTDSSGTVTKTYYDDAGRKTYVVENYDGTKFQTEPSVPSNRDTDINRVTAYTYTTGGQAATQVAIDPDADGSTSDNQVTTYVYGTTLAESEIASNQLLRAVIYPDADDVASPLGNGTDGVFDRIEFTYNRLGQIATRKDQREAVNTYGYDALGRLLHDRLTSLGRSGESVDGTVLRLTNTYDVRGLLTSTASYDNAVPGSGNVINEVERVYSDLGQLITEYQEHDGAVNTSTSPKLQLAYDQAATSGVFDNSARLSSVTYPNGTKLGYGYGVIGSVDDVLSRPSQILGYTGTSSTIELAEYEYTGSGRLATKTLGQGLTSNSEALVLNFAQDHPDTTSTEAYGGYDRFGRIARMHWEMKGGVTDTDVFDIRHGYDRTSSKLYAERKVYTNHTQAFGHDDLHRMTSVNRGFAPVTSGSYSAISDLPGVGSNDLIFNGEKQDWDLDALGNPVSVDEAQSSNYVKNTSFSDANEFESREVKATSGAVLISETFSSSSTASHWESIGSETVSISGGRLSSSAVMPDNLNGQTEATARGVFLRGGDYGPTSSLVQLKFSSTITQVTRAGFVFGYVDEHNYWLCNFKYDPNGQDTREICQITNGVLAVKAFTNVTINPGNNYRLYSGSTRELIQVSGTMFSNFVSGYPAGRIGLYTEHVGADFDYISFYPHDKPSDLGGRWDRYSSYSTDSGSIRLSNVDIGRHYPTLLRGARHSADKPWRSTFMFRRSSATRNRDGLRFLFNAIDHDTYDAVRVYHQASGNPYFQATSYWKGEETAIAGTWTPANAGLVPNQNDNLWVRVEYAPGTNTLSVKTLLDNTGEPSESTWNSTLAAYETTNYVMTGGRIGFRALYGHAYVKEFKLETDNDDNGTFATEYADDFGQSWSSGHTAIEHEHDAAGNLTFDGTFKYTFDAWNHLVKVQNAYRDPDAPTVVQTGSTVAEYKYDGLNRRVERKITNSGDLDATYHDYYRDWQRIETRNGSDQVVKQNIWGLQYIDELIAVVNNPEFMSNSAFDHEFDIDDAKIYMAAHDSLFNVMGLFEFSRLFADADNNGDIDTNDVNTVASYSGQQVVPAGTAPEYVDLDSSGQINFTDIVNCANHIGLVSRSNPVERYEYTPYGERQVYISAGVADSKAMSPVSRSQRVLESGLESTVALCEVGFQGRDHDEVSGLVYHRYRMTHVKLGSFMQRDPLEYVDGMSHYAGYFVMSGGLDSDGLQDHSGTNRGGRNRGPRGNATPAPGGCCKSHADSWYRNGYASQNDCIDDMVGKYTSTIPGFVAGVAGIYGPAIARMHPERIAPLSPLILKGIGIAGSIVGAGVLGYEGGVRAAAIATCSIRGCNEAGTWKTTTKKTGRGKRCTKSCV